MTIKSWKYPGGEVGVRVEAPLSQNPVFRIQNSDDLMTMFMALNCAKYRNEPIKSITIPYLPYARQDRVATVGDPNAIEVLAQLIASTGVKYVWSYDVHSEKSIKSFADVEVSLCSIPPIWQLHDFLNDTHETQICLVAPDKGACEKTVKYYDDLYHSGWTHTLKGVIQCLKVRNPITGKLAGFEVRQEDKESIKVDPNVAFVITDDIVDGGRTFLGVYDALKAAYGEHPTYLFTTHGIYSQGIDILADKFKLIASTDSFIHNKTHPKLITYPIKAI